MQRNVTVIDIYSWPMDAWSQVDLSGFSVEGLDGELGSIDNATYHVGSNALVVSTGPWIFGKKVMIPAGFITRIDEGDRRLFVNLTNDQIKAVPDFDESRWRDDAYRDELGAHYAELNRPVEPDFGRDIRPT